MASAGWSRAKRRGAVPRGDVLVATWGGGGNVPPLLSVARLLGSPPAQVVHAGPLGVHRKSAPITRP